MSNSSLEEDKGCENDYPDLPHVAEAKPWFPKV